MAPAPDPYQPYLLEADGLFEGGNVVKAGQIWQAILKRDPNHREARAGLYKVKVYFDARATQDGLGPEGPQAKPEPVRDPALVLERGCALYDEGRRDEAVAAWEEVLTLDPGNALAKGYLEGARRQMAANPARTGSFAAGDPAPEAAPEPASAPAQADGETLERLLRDGCTLFDMGQAEDALRKWEQILALDPNHALALAYAEDARRELGLGAGEVLGAAPAPAAPVQAPAKASLEQVDRLVHDGVQLYDLGMTEEAMVNWRRALDLDPEHQDAAGYLRMAERDLAMAPPGSVAVPPAPAPAPPAPHPIPPAPVQPAPRPAPSPALEAALQEAELLIRSSRFDEAAQAFQRLLDLDPREPRSLHGYQQARTLLAAQAQPPAAPELLLSRPPAMPPALPVNQPRAVTARATPAREGIKVPSLKGMDFPPWLATPKGLAAAVGSVLVLILGLYFLRDHQREAALRADVANAKADAMKPVFRQVQIPTLGETPAAMRKEAEDSLGTDPLVAYWRAQECLRLDPGSAPAVQLVDRAKAQMATLPAKGGLGDYESAVKAGDLESAEGILRGLLRQSPDDGDLKDRARTINLALAQTYALKERFGDAKDCLCRGRAMYPQDKSWQGKLQLLETIQGMAKGDRAAWIQLLG